MRRRCFPAVTEVELETGETTLRAFAARAREIAAAEGIDGLPEAVYREAAVKTRGNMRALLQRIESGAFRDDAAQLIERELAMLRSTKGERAESRRAELTATLARLNK